MLSSKQILHRARCQSVRLGFALLSWKVTSSQDGVRYFNPSNGQTFAPLHTPLSVNTHVSNVARCSPIEATLHKLMIQRLPQRPEQSCEGSCIGMLFSCDEA